MANIEEMRIEMQKDYDKLLASKEDVSKDVTILRKGTKMMVSLQSAIYTHLMFSRGIPSSSFSCSLFFCI